MHYPETHYFATQRFVSHQDICGVGKSPKGPTIVLTDDADRTQFPKVLDNVEVIYIQAMPEQLSMPQAKVLGED